jgi:hypothetical protein
MNRDSRLFKSVVLNPPTPEEIAWRQYPFVDLWNAREQREGRAVMELEFFDGIPTIIYQMTQSPGDRITHWRWSRNRDTEPRAIIPRSNSLA